MTEDLLAFAIPKGQKCSAMTTRPVTGDVKSLAVVHQSPPTNILVDGESNKLHLCISIIKVFVDCDA